MPRAQRAFDQWAQKTCLVVRRGDGISASRRVAKDEDRLCGDAADGVARGAPDGRITTSHACRCIEGGPARYGARTGRWRVEEERYEQRDRRHPEQCRRYDRPSAPELTPSVLDVGDDESGEHRNEPG